MPSNNDLWQRIQAFPLDAPGDEFPFSARLARENGWSPEWAGAAIDEYRKFVYLLCVTPEPLTPSEVVDQVWHLHLVYTRSYWTDFCEGLLGRPLHHEPSTGGGAQAFLFDEQYARTRSQYAAEFGFAPPIEYWPLVPFANQPNCRWIDRRAYWIVPKLAGRRFLATVAALALISLLAGCESLWAGSGAAPASIGGRIFGSAVILAPFWLMAIVGRPKRKDNSGGDSSSWGIGTGGCGGGCGSGCGGGCGGGGCGG